MITCDFYLNNRIKTITGENIKACWKTFNTDFGEAISELCKVKVIYCKRCKKKPSKKVKKLCKVCSVREISNSMADAFDGKIHTFQ